MAAINHKGYAAGLKDVKIKLASGVEYDVLAAKSLASSPDSTVVDVEGDDKKLASFTFNMAEEITFQMDGISMDCLQAIVGTNFSVSNNSYYSLPLGTQDQDNPPFFEISGYTRAKDINGVKATAVRKFYRCQLQNGIEFSQEYQGVFSVTMTVKAFYTEQDITGALLNPGRISELIFLG